MRLPALKGVIRRRLLVNFRVDPDVMARALPSRLRPKLHGGHAIAGVCLLRLEEVRPSLVPAAMGIASENAAHRVAVEWEDDEGKAREGVFITRRDTGSLVNHIAGGRLFPGEHHRATFDVVDDGSEVSLTMCSLDEAVRVEVRGRASRSLPAGSCFASVDEVSAFFARGSVGYSTTGDSRVLDGVRLDARGWRVEPFAVEHVRSTYFDDEARFPKGSLALDCALVMRDIEHDWHAVPDLAV